MPTEADVSNFLASLVDQGLGHSTINVARSAISAYLIKHRINSIGSKPAVCRLVKGVFNLKPSIPRYSEMWDVDTVLELLRTWPSLEEIDLKQLTLRTVMLLALVSGQRGQSLHALLVNDIKFSTHKCTVVYSSLLKQSKAGSHMLPLVLDFFNNQKLCVISHLKTYIEKTQDLRHDNKLFISFVKPHNHISRDTLSRWIKMVLDMAGIDTTVFSAHSTRSASTSAAFRRDANMDSILNAAGWSNDSTFKRFYLKPVTQSKSFSQTILDSFINK